MKDKLTKKRDYVQVIINLKLYPEFVSFVERNKKVKSRRRLGYLFLRYKGLYFYCKIPGIFEPGFDPFKIAKTRVMYEL